MNKHDFLNKTQYFSRSTITIEGLGELYIQELSAADMAVVQDHVEEGVRVAGYTVALGLLNDKGKRMFTASTEDIDSIMDSIRLADLILLSEAITKLSGLEELDEGK